MTKIEEKRQLLDKKLKEMSEDGVMKKPQVVTAFFDPPDDEDDVPITPDKPEVKEEEIARPTIVEEPQTKEPKVFKQPIAQPEYKEEVSMTIEDYRSLYFQPTRIREKTAFTMSVETLEILRSVLQDLRERVSMASYLDNIVREHFRTHRELLNQATAKQRRKTTITI
ncbi:MAG: DUF3408 domain-containing protein [Porphyromonadaceae bacterium]|nr:DUF3408 domain-containing protein [Porphyromonadaceae bacterium]